MASPPAPDLLALPTQTGALFRDLLHWLRHDSVSALIGVAFGIALYLILLGVRQAAKGAIGRASPRGSFRWVAWRVVDRTRSFFLAALSAELVSLVAAPPGAWLTLIGFLFTVAAAIQGGLWLRALALALIERRAQHEHGADSTLASAIGVLNVLVTVAVWALVLVVLLDNLGVNVTALVAGLGIGGIAIGLAAQGIFADLFAALAILLDRPFRRGDTISFGPPPGTTGTVEAIGLKTTRLRAPGGEQVVVGNTKLLSDQIRNNAHIEARTVTMAFLLDLETPPETLARVPDLLRAAVEQADGADFVRATVHNASATAFETECVFTLADAAFDRMMAARQAVLLGFLAAAEKEGLRLARPRV